MPDALPGLDGFSAIRLTRCEQAEKLWEEISLDEKRPERDQA